MEKLVGEASRVGISSLTDLGKYHREFIAMTTFLIAKNHISADEPPHQIRSYTILFSLFLHFPYVADPPLHTSAPMQPHATTLVLARQSHLLYRTDLAYLMDI